MSRLAGWTPFRAAWHREAMIVDWCHLGEKRFTEPFFYETISKVIGHPFNQAFQQRTHADELVGLSAGLRPSGFIFHMARCGSTLCAQALAADPAHIVVSEALPIRAMLQAPLHGPASPAQAEAWLAGIVGALGRPRFAGEARYVVKFMAADVLDIGRVTRTFPDVPWLFLYRDPLEILASQRKLGGADTLPGQIPPETLGLTREAVFAMPPETYQCHVMAAFGRAALAAHRPGRSLVLAYRDLPDALWERIPAHFGFVPDGTALAAMRAVAGRHSKIPDAAFMPDDAAKRDAASPWRAVADAVVGPTIAALDAARDQGDRAS